MSILLFILGLILFVGLVVVHELGHAIAARRNGVEVEEFGVGFPPKAWGRRLKNGTLFTLNWLPLGGFVKLKGEHDAAEGPGSYGGASLWAKTKILLAGVVMNWLAAALIFTILAGFGIPKIFPHQFSVPGDTTETVTQVRAGIVGKDSPAEKAGVQPGDRLIALNHVEIKTAEQFTQLVAQNAGQNVQLSYDHKGEIKTTAVKLNAERIEDKGLIGIAPSDQILQRATWSAPIVGVVVTAQFTWENLRGLGEVLANLFTGKVDEAGKSVAGPIGIVGFLKDSSELGIRPVLFLIGIISLTLAVMNALPIPALDGGRLFVTVVFRLLKRPLTKEREESIQAVGFVALLVLVVVVSAVDVFRIF